MTPPQEKFARLVAEGMDHTKAYREAYPASRKWKDGIAKRRASDLMRKGDLSVTIDKLRKAANAATSLKIGEMQTILSDRIRAIVDEGGDTADLCRAADSLARISGWNQPDAVAVAAVQIVTPEERARKIREALGIPEEVEG